MVTSNEELESNTPVVRPPAPAGLLASAVANLLQSSEDSVAIVETTPSDADASVVTKLDEVASRQHGADTLTRSIHTMRGWMNASLGIGLLAAAGCGILAGLGSLDTQDDQPVNIFWLIGAVLGGQTLLLALWFLLLLFGGRILRRWSVGGLLLDAASWCSTRGGSSGRDDEGRRRGRAAAAAVTETDLGGARTRWALGAVTNLAWLSFNMGLLGTLIGVLSVRQFDFGWETTIGNDAFFLEATRVISIAPEWVGFNVPDQAMVEAARIDPATGELAGGGDEARKAFGGLLMGSIVLYGIAPRLIFFLLCLLTWSGLRRRWRPTLESARFAPLRRLIEPQAVQVAAVEFIPETTESIEEEELPPPDRQTIGSAILGIELDTPVCGWPPPCGAPVDDLGMVESREDRVATIRTLRYGRTLPARLVVVANVATSPDRGIARSIQLAHEAAEEPRLVMVLTGGGRFRDRVDAHALERRIGDWRTLIKELGVNGEVHELDLDNLTATSRARLSEVVSGNARPKLPIERGPVATIDAAFAEIGAQVRRWHGAPSEKDRLALHKAVARCAGAESGSILKGMPSTEELAADPKAAITDASRKVLALLPPKLATSGRWAAIGGTVGALACLATAGTIAPAVLAALPVWLATGAASGAGLAALSGDSSSKSSDLVEEDVARGEAVAGAAMHAVLLTFQGRGERQIQEMLEKVFDGEPPSLPDAESAAHALSRWRSRIVIASHELRQS